MTHFLIKKFIKNFENTDNPSVRTDYGKFAGWVGIFSNIFLFVIKFLAGALTKSISITADSINNLSDAGSSIVSLIGFKLAGKPADEEHPYGHGRYEYISALTVAAIIMVIGIELLKTSISKIISPTLVKTSFISISILVISILIKLWLSIFNKKIGKKINSQTLLATAQDSRNDVFSTSAVLAALLINFLFNINIDGLIGLGVSFFILYSGFGLIKETLDPLLGNAPDKEFVDYVQHKIMSYPGVLGTHDLIIHDYGPGRRFASVHVEVAAEDEILESHDSIDNIERDFLSEDNLNLIIHMDPIVTSDKMISDLRSWLSIEVKKIHSSLSIHDLRVVPGNTHTNVIFDCVVPHNVTISHKEIREEINKLIQNKYQNYFAVITFDSSFAPVQK